MWPLGDTAGVGTGMRHVTRHALFTLIAQEGRKGKWDSDFREWVTLEFWS